MTPTRYREFIGFYQNDPALGAIDEKLTFLGTLFFEGQEGIIDWWPYSISCLLTVADVADMLAIMED